MRSIFTAKERKVVLFLSVLFLLGNGIRLYHRMSAAGRGRPLDLGSLEPADSALVAGMLERSLEIERRQESVKDVDFPIDINKASLWEIVALPGIGPERAEKIVEEREKRGGFHSLSDLLDIPGIGERTVEALDGYVTGMGPDPSSGAADPNPPPKVDLNRADRRQLESLPGIGKILAGRIVSYRDDHGGFRSLEELKEVKGIGKERLKDLEPYLTLDGD